MAESQICLTPVATYRAQLAAERLLVPGTAQPARRRGAAERVRRQEEVGPKPVGRSDKFAASLTRAHDAATATPARCSCGFPKPRPDTRKLLPSRLLADTSSAPRARPRRGQPPPGHIIQNQCALPTGCDTQRERGHSRLHHGRINSPNADPF
jgi:hypothetical protein